MSNTSSPNNAHTPALTASEGASPAFSTILDSPHGSTLDVGLGLTLGEPVLGEKAKDGFKLPECWGHRGASASFPENTRASFMEACKAGADGIETDIHMTSDNVLVMFHDPELGRATTGNGKIDQQLWHGVLEHVRTKAKPIQPIPLFHEILDILLMPGNEHVKLNLDCKVENDPIRLFTLVKEAIQAYDSWTTKLAPRIILGIWHPKYIEPALTILPYLPRYAICMSIPLVRQYFFNTCHGFSIMFEALASLDGLKFRNEVKAAGKVLCAWTVNEKDEMRECVRWGVGSMISDKPELWRLLKKKILNDKEKALKPTLGDRFMPYLRTKNYKRAYIPYADSETVYLEKEGGKFAEVVIPDISLRIAKPGDAFCLGLSLGG